MTRFKSLGVAAVLCTVIATPGIAQQAVQEPGARAFYQSLGVGSSTDGLANAVASLRTERLYAGAPVKHHSRAQKR